MIFDDLKHFVDIHPVRHWKEVRVRSHVFLCILALLLKRIFEVNCMNGKTCMQPLEEISKSKLIKYVIRVKITSCKTRILNVGSSVNRDNSRDTSKNFSLSEQFRIDLKPDYELRLARLLLGKPAFYLFQP